MKRFSLDLLQAVKKRICIGSGVWGCAEFVITSKFFFDFVILSWGKQWEVLIVAIVEQIVEHKGSISPTSFHV